MSRAIKKVHRSRNKSGDAYYFNWLLGVPDAHQLPFEVTHQSVADLKLSADLSPAELAVQLRRAFSAIVTGNVKDHGIRMIKKDGPFQLRADTRLVEAIDQLLKDFASQGRMKLHGEYKPCYEVVSV